MKTLRRMAGLLAGYAIAVIVSSIMCIAFLSIYQEINNAPGAHDGLNMFQTTIIGGTLITASTAWPGYLVTSWLLLSKRLANTRTGLSFAGALTAVQALVCLSFVTKGLVPKELWLPAIISGAAGAFTFSLLAQSLFGMTFKQSSRPPLPSKS